MANEAATEALSRVLWIGGPPDCGKTTAADWLGAKYGLQVYHFDRHETEHIRRADPRRQPRTFELGKRLAELDERAFAEWLWLRRTPGEMAEDAIKGWSERISFVIEDLLALPMGRPIVAEGPGFFPETVLPLLASPRQAIWMAPSESFKRASHRRRRKGEQRARLLDRPEQAQHHHIERDLIIAEHYRRSVRERGLALIEVDESRSASETAAEAERHFGPLLPGPNV